MLAWTMTLGGLLVAFVLVMYGAPLLARTRQVARWKRHGSGMLALTYDDGPDSTTTPAVLDLLNEHGVRATFYLVGFRAEQQPEVCARIVSEGHEVGTHTHRHKNAWKVGPVREYLDAHRAYRTLAEWIATTDAYRPPFGKATLPTWLSMRLARRRVEWWTTAALDTRDSFPDPGRFADEILAKGGPVLLMHCHHAVAHRRGFVLDLTRELITRAQSSGVRLVTMSELESACR